MVLVAGLDRLLMMYSTSKYYCSAGVRPNIGTWSSSIRYDGWLGHGRD